MKRVRYYFFAVLLSLITVFALVQPPKPVYASCAEGATKCSGTSVYVCVYPQGWVYDYSCGGYCCSGGACTSTVPYCSSSLSCKCGCTKSCSGGTCNVCPTATNTSKPTATKTPTKTPTPVYTCNGDCYLKGEVGSCAGIIDGTTKYCTGSGTCPVANICCKVCPTNTPTKVPTATIALGGCHNIAYYVCSGSCSVSGATCSTDGTSTGCRCYTASSTNTPTKTPTLTPSPTTKINSCTGSTDCIVDVYEIPGSCECSLSGEKYVYAQCKDLLTGLFEPCDATNGCQTSTTCNVTPTANPTIACNDLTSSSCVWYAQNDCGGSSCGCGQRRTALLRCYGVHCADTCATDTTCTNECSSTPVPTSSGGGGGGGTTGTLTAKAVTVEKTDTSCLAIQDSTSYLDGTVISFSPSVGSKTQTMDGILTWSGVNTGTYTISGVAPESYALGNVCVSSNESAYSQLSSGVLTSAGTLSFIMGYVPQNGWAQTVAGNVYAANTLISSVPTTATNAYFSLAGAMGAVGMVTYGVNYDFSLDTSTLGETMISTKNWLMKQVYTSTDFYTQFATRLDIPDAAKAISTADLATPTLCTSSPCLLYADGDLLTPVDTSRTISENMQEILFVNGNVTINNNISVASGGFFAMIVHGNITIAPTVTTLQGIYIATNADHTAVISTGSGTDQLTVTGSVIADNFSLLRDLGSTVNSTTPAERFIFNPEFLFTMPDTMKEIPYIWQEVAP